MVTHRLLVALAGSVSLAAVATPARAQVPLPVVKTDTTALTPWAAKPVGTYDLAAEVDGRTVPATLIISDSAQQLRGIIRTEEDGEVHVVTVTVSGTDLTLNGVTNNGALTIVFRQRGGKITGTWRIENNGEGAITATKRSAI